MKDQQSTYSCRRLRASRSGGVYVFVLMTATLVSVIAIGVVQVAQSHTQAIYTANDSAQAAGLAQSAIDVALLALANDVNWRNDYPAAMNAGPIQAGAGSLSFAIIDDVGGSITANPLDPIRIYGVGVVRSARRIYSVQCTAITPMDCLKNPLVSGGPIQMTGAAVGSQAPFSLASNTSISLSGSQVLQPCNMICPQTGQISVSTTSGSWTPVAGSRQLPDPIHVFDYYKSQAVTIPLNSLPTVAGVATMQMCVLSPASNPFGSSTQPQGIYLINCNGQPLQIANVRVVGTLIILNPGAGSGISQSNLFSPVVTGYPSLMVSGDWSLGMSNTPLADSANTGNAQVPAVNYNSTGTPYQGIEDNSYTTTYPSRLEGIIYVSGNAVTSNFQVINGVLLVGGSVTQNSGSLWLNYDSTSWLHPPPGFLSNVMTPVGGSWRWESAQ